MQCDACGTPVTATARFCHKCGARVGAPHSAGWRAGLPWGIAGAALGALIAVAALRLGGTGETGARRPANGAPLPLPAPDISQMTPEERATRLFNRVMALAEAGKADSVAFFLPMALGAYAQLPALDVDARFHIGLLHLSSGDGAGALAQADTILRTVPTHLFAYVLRARGAELNRNAARARRAYADFLAHESPERARQRPEYAEHAASLDAFHTEALRSVGPGASR